MKGTLAAERQLSSNTSELTRVLRYWQNQWMSVNGFNCFDLMYKDAPRWSHAFQSYVALTMLENHGKEETKPVKMMERTLYSGRYCFVENLHKKKILSDVDYAMLNEWYGWIFQNADTSLDLIVYLRARPETCYERIKIRNRSEESSVSVDYLKDLHTLHEDWLYHRTSGQLPCPVLVIDADQSLDIVIKTVEELKTKILCQDS